MLQKLGHPAAPLREHYDRLPAAARDVVMGLLAEALLWRGWDASDSLMPSLSRKSHATEAVRAIADVFLANGVEFEEYT